MGLSPTENKVYFGQLLGMCDQISFPLGMSVLKVNKQVMESQRLTSYSQVSRRSTETTTGPYTCQLSKTQLDSHHTQCLSNL